MAEPDQETQTASTSSGGVFISHIHEDREIAEAFSTLVRDVTAGMVQTFASSSTSSDAGIKYGDEWFQWIKSRVENADHVVALLTPRSVDKPWILFEAGLGKAQTSSMFGVAVGMSVADASVGPFGVFQNSSADRKSLVKLCEQLATQANLRPRPEVVGDMVDRFIATVEGIVPHDESVVEDPKSAALFQAIDDLKFLVREQRHLHEPRSASRSDRDAWRAAIGLLEEETIATPLRRRILTEASTILISPLIGMLAHEAFDSVSRSARTTERNLEVLDRALSETRLSPQNDWVFFFLRREMSAAMDHAADIEAGRRERFRERQMREHARSVANEDEADSVEG
ncbi:hypothetical protein QE370_002297 [Aeromicrobium sp. SORGH_AS981]|uniref:toll/interleukin-1 receptor domain-containing protein n=1 Tax=Aeromicrobium sp. SORGH_AS_0981 TaxID=3041802 RepID=UPI0028608CBC|nr:toll/interleukin-1 receptor domain-containing protein [Aeromicrobium sp. SORGH_AS_0981]MDR6119113.1 hypothetical protein [Aeromicrobium sp. SORGH_AS_0981]